MTTAREALQDVKPDMGDVVAGLPLTRLAMGAASPLIASAQLGAHAGDWINQQMGVKPVVSPWIDQKIREYEAAKQRGMKASGDEGYDWMGLAGSMVPSGKMLSETGPMLQKLSPFAQRTVQGGLLGATTPATSQDFGLEKGLQTASGAFLGGAQSLAGTVGTAISNVSSPILDLFRKSGPANFLRRYQREVIGEPQIPAVQSRLSAAQELVPGSKPTAAEAVAGLPEGSPVQAAQRITARTGGGPSAQFGQRVLDQEAARKAALEARDVATKPMREAALQAANATGGIPTANILTKITDLEQKPGARASDVIAKTLSNIKEKLQLLGGKNQKIDAHDLYTIRKELGTTIGKFSKETQNWDKKLTAGLEKDIQHSIDEAIEEAGGTGWKDYLREYALKSKGVSEDIARKKLSLKPIQTTDLTGGVNVSKEVMPHLPNMLSRPVMVSNWLLNKLGKGSIEPQIDALAAELYLNPQKLAPFLNQPQPNPQVQRMLGQLAALSLMGGAKTSAQAVGPFMEGQ